MLTLLLLLLQDARTYRNTDYRVALHLPADMELKGYSKPEKGEWWNWSDCLAEIRSRAGGRLLISGRLLYFDSGMEPGPYAKWREGQWGKTCTDVRRVGERAIEKKTGSWLRVEYTFEWASNVYRYVHLIGRDGKHNLELILWCSESVWEESKAVMGGILGEFEYGELREPPKLEKPRTEGPAVKVREDLFAGCGAGTSVTFRLSSAGGERRITQVLLWHEEGKGYVLRTDVDGVAGRPVEHVVEGGRDPSGTEEEIEVPAGKFKCRRTDRVWSCPDVPGHTVKRVLDAGGAKSTLILIAIERK